MLKIAMAAFILPLVLLLFSSNIFLGDRRNEHNTVFQQNRMSGTWTMDVPAGAQKARLRLQQQQNDDDWASLHVPLTQLRGLNAADRDIADSRTSFQLTRDAGTFNFTGSFRNGRGSGEWTFNGNSTFAGELLKYGYDRLPEEQLCKLVLYDIGTAYIRELAQAGYRNLSVNDLNALYYNNVGADYITSLQSVGYSKLSLHDLLALKTNGVTGAYIKTLQSRGYKNLSVQRILSLRTNPGN